MRRTYNDDGKPLSKRQKAKLCQLAKTAFELQESLGTVEAEGRSASERLKNWRRDQQKLAVGIASLTKCQNGHFRRLRGHFLALGGREDKAYRDYTTTGKVKDRGPVDDTHENRELWRNKIKEELAEHERVVMKPQNAAEFGRGEIAMAKGGLIEMGYAVNIAKRKWPGVAVANLKAEQIKIVFIELRNRIASREGRGKSKARNMKQRPPRKGGAA